MSTEKLLQVVLIIGAIAGTAYLAFEPKAKDQTPSAPAPKVEVPNKLQSEVLPFNGAYTLRRFCLDGEYFLTYGETLIKQNRKCEAKNENENPANSPGAGVGNQ